MDQTTRNHLQRATQEARRLLEAEFAAQLEGLYDILPDGTILPEPGRHLDDRQKFVRHKLVETIEHLRLKEAGKTTGQAIDDYLREAAFTVLNRFAALKMLEARDLVQQCVTRGDQSSGFKEFIGLAPGLASLPDKGYQLYLECLFDELGTEVKVLFDRRDSASLCWPRRQALLDLLDILNREALQGIWSADETIGWVYQYFNRQEERKTMRDQSAAPRNSRELAVRNQFFTPRYVVELLTDNTLGRIWYEMTEGRSTLKDLCRSMFGSQNDTLECGPEHPPSADESKRVAPQGDSLAKSESIPRRTIKDPRDIKMFDPACGSMHFGLYAFDLFERIYEEAWDLQANDEWRPIPGDNSNYPPLTKDYPSKEEFLRDVPRLIIEHNIHGIDIDPRAVQIAGLSLWLRAQRSWQVRGIKPQARPQIRRSNIACAEPMPGEVTLLDEFVARYLSGDPERQFLAGLVRKVFDSMRLAGEAGSLLKVEEEIADEVAKAKRQWIERPAPKQRRLFAAEPKIEQKKLDLVPGITDESFWSEAEDRIYDALRAYSENAENDRGYQRRLFANDAAHGFAFIDVCRKRYDVIVMNPPFGECSTAIEAIMRGRWDSLANDIYVLFFVLASQRLNAHGLIGAITSRGFIAGRDQRDFRPMVLGEGTTRLALFVDLGLNVLDDAAVETACSVLTADDSNSLVAFFDMREQPRESLTRIGELLRCNRPFTRDLERFRRLPQCPLLYTATDDDLDALYSGSNLDPQYGKIARGLQTCDNFRFMRLYWEVAFHSLGERWRFCAKGGDYQWLTSNIVTVVDWQDGGRAMSANAAATNGNAAVTRQSSTHYFLPGATYTYRCNDFSLRALPQDCIFTNSGPAIIPHDASTLPSLFAYFLSEQTEQLLKHVEKKGKYDSGRLSKLPHPSCNTSMNGMHAWRCVVNDFLEGESRLETSPYFRGVGIDDYSHQRSAAHFCRLIEEYLNCFGVTPSEAFVRRASEAAEKRYALPFGAHHLISYGIGVAFGRFAVCEESPAVDLFAPLLDQMPALRAATDVPMLDRLEGAGFEDGIADHDPVHAHSKLVLGLQKALAVLCEGESLNKWLHSHFGDTGLREYLSRNDGFFAAHLSQYSAAFRAAPIYWQLSTPSASYSVWLYYHRLTRDTFFQVLDEYVKPKFDFERRKLERMRDESVGEVTRSQRKEIEEHEKFVAELGAMVDEVERVAPLWNPNGNDGVIINFSLLWRLVPHNKSWQSECQACWDKLVSGDYDWARLAMHLWPERVVPKCQTDASLAIAHGLEDTFWQQDERDRFVPRPPPEEGWKPVIDRLVAERTNPAVKSALDRLLAAPAVAGAGRKRTRKVKTDA